MPIKVPNDLPAVETLTNENVFVMTDTRAMTQDIRPLQILLLNLMPTKVDTETQFTRLLGNTPLQIELDLLQTSTHKAHVTSEEHMLAFYKTFDEVKGNFYDGMIITGAPVEQLKFEEVEYWEELCEIMEWTKTHVHSTFHICWGAQAGLYYHYGVKKYELPEKLSGVYLHHLDYNKGMLFRGFDDEFYVPHSRNTTCLREDIEKVKGLKVIASSDEAGVFAVKSDNDRQIFIMGHSEYDGDTLLKEYLRDKKAGLDPKVPANYFPGDDDTKEPVVRWRSCANLIYSNWLNYFVYQSTPYDVSRISEEDLPGAGDMEARIKVAKFGGTSLADADSFKQVKKIVRNDDALKIIVASAPGRIKGSVSRDARTKVTDLLIKAFENSGNGEQGREHTAKVLKKALSGIKKRFSGIAEALKLKIDIGEEIDAICADLAGLKSGAREYIMSRGEYLNAKLLAAYLGYDFVDAKDLIRFRDNGDFDKETSYKAISEEAAKHNKVVIPGFYGATSSGSIRTFSRGGSDITGSVVAAAVGADIYENWTDVSGFRMADPKVVKDPLSVPVMTYEEVREMALMGAEVMHEDAVSPARELGIPINIRSAKAPKEPGTLIVKNASHYDSILDISGIAGKTGYASIVIRREKLNEKNDIRAKLMGKLEAEGIRVVNSLSGIDSINVIVRERDLKGKLRKVQEELRKAASAQSVKIERHLAVIAIVGRKMGNTPAIGVRALEALADSGINVKMIDQGQERISMLIGIDESAYVSAVRTIYSAFTTK